MMLARCASTVLMLMPRSSAICLFRRPATMRSSTWASRVVRRRQQGVAAGLLLVLAEGAARLVEHALDQAESSSSLKGFSMKSIAPFFMV
jgi:hypothetical protein